MNDRKAKKRIRINRPPKFIRSGLFLILLVLGFFVIKERLLPSKSVAIIHNQQNISRLIYPFSSNHIDIIDADTSQFSEDDIREMIDMADGVVFAGGNDFDPTIYGGDHDLVEDYSREDDQKSLDLFAYSIEKNVPILGICRGMQLMNIYYGGSLYEDIKTQYSDQIIHRGDDRTYSYHNINILDDTYLKNILQDDVIEVNSFHHEGIKNLADGLVVSAKSPDGLIEAIENPYYSYMVGVQWHPEGNYEVNSYSKELFEDFIGKLWMKYLLKRNY